MGSRSFYRQLFAPLERAYGRLDPEEVSAVIGFELGGPLSFRTFNAGRPDVATTWVSCELAERSEQRPSESGRYELLATSNDEGWVRRILTDIGVMSLERAFGDGHALDIGACVEARDAIQGVVLECACSVVIGDETFGVMRCIGVTRPELEYAVECGTSKLIQRLRGAGIYPEIITDRRSLLL